MICFEKRLGAFDTKEGLIEKMIAANKEIFIIAGELKLSLPVYKYFPTPRMKRFFQAEDYFYEYSKIFQIFKVIPDNEVKENLLYFFLEMRVPSFKKQLIA